MIVWWPCHFSKSKNFEQFNFSVFSDKGSSTVWFLLNEFPQMKNKKSTDIYYFEIIG